MRFFAAKGLGIYRNPSTQVTIDTTKWVAGSRDNMQFVIDGSGSELLSSIDSGETFPNSLSFSDADKLSTCYIFSNGNVLLMSNDNKLYLTDMDLNTITEKFMYEADGVTLLTLTSSKRYFEAINFGDYNNDNDIIVWGNYTIDGNSVYIYYSDDFGETLKVSYDFDASIYDPRHVHIIERNPFTDKWYCTTGDNDLADPDNSQSLWMEGEFNPTTKVWTWNVLDFGQKIVKPSRLKNNGFYFRQINSVDYIYWGAETTDNSIAERGMWKSKISEFTDMSKHIRVLEFPNDTEYKLLDMLVDYNTGMVISIIMEEDVFLNNNKLILIKDWGEGDYQIHEWIGARFRNVTSVNNNGFYRIDLNQMDLPQTETFFIKPGEDLFNNI